MPRRKARETEKQNKMAARGTNTSLAAELMLLIDEEEYIQLIPPFENDDYLNKNEVSSLKKMTSGKLWVDNRKFITRQNNPITSGLFELIGNSVSKSASDTKAESCDFLLDPDNKDVRQLEVENKQQTHKRIKLEASDIHMVHRTNPADTAKTWNYIHPSGSPCGRRHRLRGNLRSDKLPDLILPTSVSNSPNFALQSPVSTPHAAMGDSEHLPERPPHHHINVGTPQASSTADPTCDHANQPPMISNVQQGLTEITVKNTQNVCTDEHEVNVLTSTGTPTVENTSVGGNQSMAIASIHVSTPRTNKETDTNQPTGETHNEPSVAITPAPSMPPAIIRLQDQRVSERMEDEIQTANTLLELHETLEIPSPNLLADYDNSEIMPVNAPPVPDYSKDYPLPANMDEPNTDDTIGYADDDENTERDQQAPDPPEPGNQPTPSREQSPPGRFKYRHHGIRRNLGSPKPKTKKYHCIYCPVVEESKRELNAHHRSAHGIMSCVDCNKKFPTPDALQRHRYIHQQNRELFKCELCRYITAFESDMKRHKIQHEDEKTWYCDGPNCTRTFKRKSDMTSHAKTHTNEDQRCPAQGCDYTNKDARNLKRHMKCHSNVKPLKCPMCPEQFKHYQQLKRHKENHP